MHRVVWIKTKCSNYYRFIKSIQCLGVNILEIKYNDNYVFLKIYSDEFDIINKYLISYNFKIVNNTGIFLIKDIIKANILFFVACLLGIISFCIFKEAVVSIRVNHDKQEIRSLIMDELFDNGIKVLSFKKNYNELNKIKQKILDEYEDKIDWLEFQINGMELIVNIEERIITDTSKDNKVCDIVAKKNGVISNILLSSGEAVVMINDYVRTGDTLITGIIKNNDEYKNIVCASGSVFATTWYTVSVSVPLNYYETVLTGKKKYNFVWENNGNKKNILKKRFNNYESKYRTLLKIFDKKL